MASPRTPGRGHDNPGVVRRSVVLAIDHPEHGRLATIAAAGLARSFGLRLVLVHLVSDPSPFPYGDVRAREIRRGHALQAGHELLSGLQRSIPGVVVEQRVVLYGDVASGTTSNLTSICREEQAALLMTMGRPCGCAGSWMLRLTEYPPPLPPEALEEPVPITRVRDLETWIPGLDRAGDPSPRTRSALRVGSELGNASSPAGDPSRVRSWDPFDRS